MHCTALHSTVLHWPGAERDGEYSDCPAGQYWGDTVVHSVGGILLLDGTDSDFSWDITDFTTLYLGYSCLYYSLLRL